MVAEPGETPVTVPVDEPMVATALLLLLQVPPEVASVNVVVAPWQRTVPVEAPDIAAGNGFTVIE
jgi:hypothetical protein